MTSLKSRGGYRRRRDVTRGWRHHETICSREIADQETVGLICCRGEAFANERGGSAPGYKGTDEKWNNGRLITGGQCATTRFPSADRRRLEWQRIRERNEDEMSDRAAAATGRVAALARYFHPRRSTRVARVRLMTATATRNLAAACDEFPTVRTELMQPESSTNRLSSRGTHTHARRRWIMTEQVRINSTGHQSFDSDMNKCSS